MLVQLDFGQALAALKEGKLVARLGWNGRNMWLALTPGTTIAAADARSGAVLAKAQSEPDSSVAIAPHIDMRSADGTIIIGWCASQTDMLATDWVVIA